MIKSMTGFGRGQFTADGVDILAEVHEKEEYEINDNLIIKPLPEEEAKKVEKKDNRIAIEG